MRILPLVLLLLMLLKQVICTDLATRRHYEQVALVKISLELELASVCSTYLDFNQVAIIPELRAM